LPGSKLTLRELLELERDLGEWYGSIFKKMIAQQKIKPDLIANHGQTIAHFPGAARKGVTLQIGDATRIAYLTGLTTVTTFRDGDMSAGGEGAPLAPGFHRLLAGHLDPKGEGTSIHNIGGISNFTYLGPSSKTERVIACDTGPGNVWIDAATELATRGKRKFDADGKLALQGEVDERAVKKILRMPYFAKKPPKSTGRDDFPLKLLLDATRARDASLVATATAITVESIAQAYERFIFDARLPLGGIHISGGGAHNSVLMNWLSDRLSSSHVQVQRLSDSGFDGKLIEAQAFAFFGLLSVLGQPVGGSWTGVKGFAPPGLIAPGENWPEVLSKVNDLDPRAAEANSTPR
jgi:anhydro-N-acetylmuramic acid kinase